MEVVPGESLTQDFSFTDGLTDQCLLEGATGCEKTVELQCIGGTSTSFEAPDFYSIDPGANQNEWTLTITSPYLSTNTITIDHNCKIVATMQD